MKISESASSQRAHSSLSTVDSRLSTLFFDCRLSTLLLALGIAACSRPAAPTEQVPPDPALEAHALESVPTDIAHRTYVDFEGKVQLIGYALDPEDAAGPGKRMKLTLYWQSSAPLGPGWSLFTHVLDNEGRQIKNADNDGPLRKLVPSGGDKQRQALPPSLWVPGKIYVDENEFDLPADLKASEITLAVGIWREDKRRLADGGLEFLTHSRLAIISGPSDGNDRAIVAHVKTAVVPATPKTADVRPKT